MLTALTAASLAASAATATAYPAGITLLHQVIASA